MALFSKTKKPDEEILAVFPEEIYRGGELALHDILTPSALEVKPTYVRLGVKFARTIFVFAYPRYLNTNWFSPVINMDKIIDIAMYVQPVDTAAMLRTLRRKVAQVQSQIAIREEKGLVRDPMLDTAYRDLEELRDKLQQAQERLFYFGLYVTIYGFSEDELNRAETEIKSILEALDQGKRCVVVRKQGQWVVDVEAKEAILAYFKLQKMTSITEDPPFFYVD